MTLELIIITGCYEKPCRHQNINDLHFDLWKYFRPAIYLWGVKDIYCITCMLK